MEIVRAEQYHILHVLEVMGPLMGVLFNPAIFEPLVEDDYIWINIGGGYRLTDKGKRAAVNYRHYYGYHATRTGQGDE